MLSATKGFLNTLFLLFSTAGFIVVFANDALPEGYAFLTPLALVAVYGLIVSRALRDCHDASFADHQLDSIYFLGFLYTLVSLVALFYQLHSSVAATEGATTSPAVAAPASALIVSQALYYVGISVSTSLAGVLFRNMARGVYLRRHPDDGDERERAETAKAFENREDRYLEALETFVETTESFNRGLSAARSHRFEGLHQRASCHRQQPDPDPRR